MMQQTKPDDPDAVDPDAIATQGVGVFFSRAVYSLSLRKCWKRFAESHCGKYYVAAPCDIM